ncbi:hypothetical protein PIIN_11609 [Serendipita indica DSM 11827]|uniref:Uncharacterized protein n=1 Tax=Serendipita indica (strain DSM 11827) TaxID=1109443 RepID=G4U238_SERID|nr:hypothetical protein PIIN_11609 [Serendipita indica DSM 11827]
MKERPIQMVGLVVSERQRPATFASRIRRKVSNHSPNAT